MSRARARIIYLGYRGGAAFLRAVPRPLGRAVAGGAALVAWGIGQQQRGVVAANLRRVLGAEAPPAALRSTVRRAYVSYAMYWLEAARLDASDPTVLARRVVVHHPERFIAAAARGRGLVVVLPHVGCWEAGAIWTASMGYPLLTVGEMLEPPELFTWFVNSRRRATLTVLPPGTATTAQLLSQLRTGQVVALLADRDVIGGGLPTKFFGTATPIPIGPAVLALRSGAAMLPVAIYLARRGRFAIDFLPEIDTTRSGDFRADVARLTSDMVRAFETLITRHPEQWHLFQANWPAEKGPSGR